jgi:hypothetical protein
MTQKTHRVIEYAVCLRCQGQGRSPVVSHFEWTCEVCSGAGKIVLREEITEETTD